MSLQVIYDNLEAIIVGITQKEEGDMNSEASEGHKQVKALNNVSLFFGMRAAGSLSVALLSGYFISMFGIRESNSTLISHINLLRVFNYRTHICLSFLQGARGNRKYIFIYSVKPAAFIDNMKEVFTVIFGKRFRRILIIALCFVIIPSFGSAYSYYFTEYLKFTPVTMGYLSFFSTLAYILAIILVNYIFKGVNFKKYFLTTMSMTIIMISTNYILLFRMNVKWGISDEVFCFSSSALIMLMAELTFMPIYALGSRLCPPGLEATTYSVFTAIFNLAHTCSTVEGALLTKLFGVHRRDFSNLWKLTTVQTSCMAIFVIALTFVKFPRIGKKKADTVYSDSFSDITWKKSGSTPSSRNDVSKDVLCKSVDGTTLPTNRIKKPLPPDMAERRSLLF